MRVNDEIRRYVGEHLAQRRAQVVWLRAEVAADGKDRLDGPGVQVEAVGGVPLDEPVRLAWEDESLRYIDKWIDYAERLLALGEGVLSCDDDVLREHLRALTRENDQVSGNMSRTMNEFWPRWLKPLRGPFNEVALIDRPNNLILAAERLARTDDGLWPVWVHLDAPYEEQKSSGDIVYPAGEQLIGWDVHDLLASKPAGDLDVISDIGDRFALRESHPHHIELFPRD